MKSTIIRPITADDAAQYNAHRRRIADEPDNNIGFSAGEYPRTVAEDRERLVAAVADSHQRILVAQVDGAIVGICAVRGRAVPQSTAHMVSLGIDVQREYRGQGIGGKLMAEMIAWAQAHPTITRIELDVFTRNRNAIGLYIKHGFVIEGLKRRAYFKYGHYVDAYLMSLLLDD